jgi:hypothetical protein
MMNLYIDGIGCVAPGLIGWPQASAVFKGSQPYTWQELPALAPAILPPTERRRCIASARLALCAASEARDAAGPATSRAPACVFASSDGDGQILQQITDSLAQEIPEVSPTRFSNSVHNAAAGYWSIAAGLKQASTCLCAFDHSFAAGMLEAAAQAVDEETDVLLTAFDIRFPAPFSELRPTAIDCAVALWLAPRKSERSLARLQIALTGKQPASAMPAGLPDVFSSNPAARALPLLAALARPESGKTISLDYLDQSLALTVSVC